MSLKTLIGQLITPKAPAQLCIPDESHISIAGIDFSRLAEQGYKLAIFDIDGTLTPFHSYHPAAVAYQTIEAARENGLDVCGLSNTSHSTESGHRISILEQLLGIRIFEASPRKPHPDALNAVYVFYDTITPHETVIVGDRLLTDILLAKRVRAYAIKVEPLPDNEEPLGNSIARLYETIIYGQA
ncbi:HAD hydrolase-like protein [Candidatus Woesearchaeota archaeon]|nr:HAD hydrolase-like protein [Candidatus Woesearchaeota archaeon]